MAYSGIRFHYERFVEDVGSFTRLATPFLDERGRDALAAFETELKNLRNAAPQRTWRLRIPEERPVITGRSEGEYRDSEKRSKPAVIGTMSCVWEIRNPDKSRHPQRYFEVVGIASTSVCIRMADNDELVARWQFEMGDHQSPGCHFHAAVNQYKAGGIFPEWLKVPRLPAILFVPTDCLEFLLGEIFQRRWYQHVTKESEIVNRWATSQSKRLSKLYKWQSEQIRRDGGTPWMTLKKARPPLDLFSGD